MNDIARLRDDARAIWQAAIDAVDSERLVHNVVRCADEVITICGQRIPIAMIGQIAVVGAGKAGAGMAAGVEQALGASNVIDRVTGWVNVPADCVRPLTRIHLHAARPPGVNEPTAEGVAGSQHILNQVESLGPDDLCLVLISGGGSALMPAPCPPLTLQDKRLTTRFLMNRGATILELNAVRKRLSLIKGGGLARASRAGQLIALIVSDIVNDPLEMIASGPTVPDSTTHAEALAILRKYGASPPDVPERVFAFLESGMQHKRDLPFPENVSNHVIGNNAMALCGAAKEARRRGYQVVSMGSGNAGEANAEGRALATRCQSVRDDPRTRQPVCILSGGEPVVQLAATDRPARGGRNQQLVLAGLRQLADDGMQRIVLLSGGSDGEDGPTDAAGAWADAEILARVRQQDANIDCWLNTNDSYSFFERFGGLLKTGPTHTNVMDVRVALVSD